MRTLGKRILILLQFFTTIPVNRAFVIDNKDYPFVIAISPIVGAIMGGLIFLLMWLLYVIGVPSVLLCALAVVLYVVVSGGIHLDGLADTCDGIFARRGRERALEIMRDSQIGAFGAMALGLDLIMRFACLWALLERGLVPFAAGVVLGPMLGKFGLTVICASGVSARPDGMGKNFIDYSGPMQALTAALICLAIAPWLTGWYAPITIFAVALIAFLLWLYIKRKLGGLTGDTLGFCAEISEVAALVLFVIFL